MQRLGGLALLACVALGCGDDAAPPGPPGVTPALLELCRTDLRITDAECQLIATWRLPSELPPARGNRFGDDDRAAELGHLVFFDDGFSQNPGVRCATCHLPDMGFADGVPTSEVVPGRPLARNSPSVLNAAWSGPWFFWDGRADSLWSQPLFAFEGADEMNETRLELAHHVYDTPDYRMRYEAIFGALPDLSDTVRFPARGKPGDAAFDGMAAADRDAINGVAANVGKALEAYMRKVATGPSAVDRYLDGDRRALEPTARLGLAAFVRSGCIECHAGPGIGDLLFRPVVRSTTMDRGRAAGIEVLLASPFNSAGMFFDAGFGDPAPLPPGPMARDERAFRTPALRNVALTAPYGHAGTYGTLDDVLTTGDGPMGAGEAAVIRPFLMTLNGEPPPAEWTVDPFP